MAWKLRAHCTVAVLVISLGLATAASSLAQDASPVASPAADPGSCPVSGPDEASELGTAFLDAVNNRDYPALLTILAPDYVHRWGVGDDTIGPEAYIARVQTLVTALPDLTFTPTDIIARDDLVVFAVEGTSTQTQPFMGFPASDRTTTWTGLFVLRIACGQIADSWVEADHLSRLQQQGAISGMAATPEP